MWTAITAAVVMAGLVWVTHRACTMLERRAVRRAEIDAMTADWASAQREMQDHIQQVERAGAEHGARLDELTSKVDACAFDLESVTMGYGDRLDAAESKVAAIQTAQAVTPTRSRWR